MSAKARQKARELIELATNERTPENEAISAAQRAVKIIRKYDLLDSPIDAVLPNIDNDTVAAFGTILKSVTNPELISSAKKIASQFGRRKR